MLKNAYFLKKYIKKIATAPLASGSPDPRVVTPAYYDNFVNLSNSFLPLYSVYYLQK